MLASYLTLFTTAWVSATLWPMASEAVFVALLHQNSDALLPLLIVASLGNTLGSITMFELALQSRHWLVKRKKFKLAQVNRALQLLNSYGAWVLLLAWLPVVGDLLPVAAGFLKIRRMPVYIALAVGKTARYLVLASAVILTVN